MVALNNKPTKAYRVSKAWIISIMHILDIPVPWYDRWFWMNGEVCVFNLDPPAVVTCTECPECERLKVCTISFLLCYGSGMRRYPIPYFFECSWCGAEWLGLNEHPYSQKTTFFHFPPPDDGRS